MLAVTVHHGKSHPFCAEILYWPYNGLGAVHPPRIVLMYREFDQTS
jgi:hypothetical protein